MPTAADVIAVARTQVGYVEKPTNITKFWDELDPKLQGNPWCAAFVSWVFKHAGKPLPNMGKDYGFSFCPYAEAYARKNGLWDEDGLYQPGDVILYGTGLASHTGIVVADNGFTITTIEGNTSSGESGSQVNGGGVYLRHRPHGPWVRGVLATSRLLDKPVASPVPRVFRVAPPFPYELHLGAKNRYVGMVQARLNEAMNPAPKLTVDNDYGPATKAAVTRWQQQHTFLDVDGVVGPATWKSIFA